MWTVLWCYTSMAKAAVFCAWFTVKLWFKFLSFRHKLTTVAFKSQQGLHPEAAKTEKIRLRSGLRHGPRWRSLRRSSHRRSQDFWCQNALMLIGGVSLTDWRFLRRGKMAFVIAYLAPFLVIADYWSDFRCLYKGLSLAQLFGRESWIIADYWSDFRCIRGPLFSRLIWARIMKLTATKLRHQKNRTITVSCSAKSALFRYHEHSNGTR